MSGEGDVFLNQTASEVGKATVCVCATVTCVGTCRVAKETLLSNCVLKHAIVVACLFFLLFFFI